MKDVSRKIKTSRSARAQAVLTLRPQTVKLLREGQLPKGDPIPVAKVAAIQAAKNASQIIPYCHPIPLDFVGCSFEIGESSIVVSTEVKAIFKTGVEMEALTAASVAALTLYDMLKPVDETMIISDVRLVEKRGGKSDHALPAGEKLRVAVVVISDSVASGAKKDTSGRHIEGRLQELGLDVVEYKVIPDHQHVIEQTLIRYSDELKLDLVITTGGTGLSATDVTPEAMAGIVDKEIPGIVEAARVFGQERTPLAMLSRAKAGVRGTTIIVNLPGSRKAVEESLDAILPGLLHGFRMMRGEGH
ncbi:MAG TPA: bifunctional molybdenum cofactor biosynthesis protein MoaC/MoaB [Bacteroidetes bacterium]|nr:bifunctional molybdenum cofactor biosynthesis protein MoaC/MoaB [Bacteroidota bacterium]